MASLPAFAVLFDWDGVVIDSSRHHQLSWELLAKETGNSISNEQFWESFGQQNKTIIPNLLGWAQDPQEIESLSLRKESLYRDLLKDKGISPLDGVVPLVSALKEAGIPRVVGTSSARENIETALEVMKLEGFFDDVVAAADVEHGKPHPEVFLNAADRARTAPEMCVVIEDSHHGLQAARAGGMKSVGVLSSHSREKLSEADLIVSSMTEISPEVLASLF